MNVYTHDRVDFAGGLMANTSLLYGKNALQTINVTRNTPRNAQSAIGYLGIVDYTRGIITSDVTLDSILVEHGSGSGSVNASDTITGIGSVLACPGNSVNLWGGVNVNLATEIYALTGCSLSFAAGSPSTVNYQWITAGLASYIKAKVAPAISDGTQFAMVLGDMGAGLLLIATWSGSAPTQSTVPTVDANGNLTSVSDYGLPVGVQRVNMSSTINRDHILDVRSTRPVAFVTTYPIDVNLDLEVHQLPGTGTVDAGTIAPAWNQLTGLAVVSASDVTRVYAKTTGLVKTNETESIAVGRYLSYNVQFHGTDLQIPLAAIS